jgi:hypothetical protein
MRFLQAVVVQVLVSSAFSVVDESVRTLVRERVRRSRFVPQGNLGQ